MSFQEINIENEIQDTISLSLIQSKFIKHFSKPSKIITFVEILKNCENSKLNFKIAQKKMCQ